MKPSDMKPSERIYAIVGEQEVRNKLNNQAMKYVPGFVELLLPAILKYLDEQAQETKHT